MAVSELFWTKSMVLSESEDLVLKIKDLLNRRAYDDVLNSVEDFQKTMQRMCRDYFSEIAPDVFKLILLKCPLETQINLTLTCKRFHSFPWLQDHWKQLSIETILKMTPFFSATQINRLEKVMERSSTKWSLIANCLIAKTEGWTHINCDPGNIHFGKVMMKKLVSGYPVLYLNISYCKYGSYLISGNGFGIIEQDQFSYVGNFAHEKFSGPGQLIENGIKYNGTFMNHKFHGEGEIEYPDGFKWKGQWISGQPSSRDLPVHPQTLENLRNGKCTKTIVFQNPTHLAQFGSYKSEGFYCESCLTNGNHRYNSYDKIWAMKQVCCCRNTACLGTNVNAKRKKRH
eukprot:TRINITY_DN2217_c0_g2_i1.p1 TRINITY_DN2217_c0_g2~~TRINITY_DN2217_c0_g2_i1.p1  ORF type:complete len:343 (+),score=41.10 TRINITY_DN2217_c0_g2_i1:13-1041(+)